MVKLCIFPSRVAMNKLEQSIGMDKFPPIECRLVVRNLPHCTKGQMILVSS